MSSEIANAPTITNTTPPPLQGVPTAKEKKYDRQLRLWAASGQAALEDAHLLLVNSGPGVVGVEALKNLVLPGIGHFTILDDAVVTEEDLGVNFFLEEDSLGKPRAEETCKYLQELNPDVSGNSIVQPVANIISNVDALGMYSIIVVVAPIDATTLQSFLEYGNSRGIPVFYIHSVGFYTRISILVSHAFPIVDTHPDPATTADLRLMKPWPALAEYAKRKTESLEDMDDHIHGHVPYLLLILYYLEMWKENYGKLPSHYPQKLEFKKLVKSGMRMHNAEGGEENYEQAVAAVLKNLNDPVPSSAVKEVFNAAECVHITAESPNFWVIAQAISRFHAIAGVLPLQGAVPDMKAISSDYVELQNVYKSKARQDVTVVTGLVRTIESEIARSNAIPDREIEAFCKGAAHIKLIRGQKFPVATGQAQDLQWGQKAARRAFILMKDEGSGLRLFIAFLAYDTFYQSTKTVAGQNEDDIEHDAAALSKIADEIIAGLLQQAKKDETEEITIAKQSIKSICHELARAGGGELHNISSLAGGLVAQEIIKVITKQYIPVDNICLFDGIKSVATVLKL